MDTIENAWNIMKRLVTKVEMLKPVCDGWYSVAPNVLEEHNNSMARRITDLINAKRGTKKY